MRKTFDDILRRRWEQQQFPVDQDHRQHMLELLEGKKKRRAFAFWWWGAGAVVIVAGYFIWQSTQLNNATDTASIVAPAAPVTNNTSVETADHAIDISGATGQTGSTISPAASTTEVAADHRDVKANTATGTKSPASSSANTASSSKSLSNKTTQTSTFNQKNASKPAVNPALTQSANKTEDVAQTASLADNTAANKSNTNLQPSIHQETISSVEPEKPIEPLQQQRSLVDIAWLDALPVEQLPIERDHSIGSIKPVKKTLHPLYVFGEAGAGMIIGSKPDYPGGWKLNAGAGLGYLLQPKMHLMLSGGYLLQDGGFDFERTSTVTTQHFGWRNQLNSLEPDKLHYMYGKLAQVYRMKKHSLGASFGLQYLYGAQGYIHIHTEDQLLGESDNVPHYAWLSMKGFNRYQYNAGLQYGYRLTPQLSIAGGAQYYFNSLIANDPALQAEGYNWKGKTAKVQPFITFNYLLYGPF